MKKSTFGLDLTVWPYFDTWVFLLNSWYTAMSRKVVGKTVHATIPKGNMGYDQCTFPGTVAVESTFCCFPLALANIRPWPLVPFFEISLKNSELKITHNTFRDCRVHFFREPFLKQLYINKVMITVKKIIITNQSAIHQNLHWLGRTTHITKRNYKNLLR